MTVSTVRNMHLARRTAIRDDLLLLIAKMQMDSIRQSLARDLVLFVFYLLFSLKLAPDTQAAMSKSKAEIINPFYLYLS